MATIGIDGDDTLWHNEGLFRDVEAQFHSLVGQHYVGDDIAQQLLAVEHRNVAMYGYGAKSFMLSMIETAVALTDGVIASSEIASIIELGHELLREPVVLIDGVADAVADLAKDHELHLITKGDLVNQQHKVDLCGLTQLFREVHIVAEKDPNSYRSILTAHNIALDDFVMVGNSAKSDVLPVLDIGAWAIHVPYRITWAAELVESPAHEFPVVDGLNEVAALVESRF
ncbi:MAG: HAD family hydrolase [Acidimicrobiales bacterium]